MNGDILMKFDETMLTLDDGTAFTTTATNLDNLVEPETKVLSLREEEYLETKDYKKIREAIMNPQEITMDIKISKLNKFKLFYGWEYVKNYISYWISRIMF